MSKGWASRKPDIPMIFRKVSCGRCGYRTIRAEFLAGKNLRAVLGICPSCGWEVEV